MWQLGSSQRNTSTATIRIRMPSFKKNKKQLRTFENPNVFYGSPEHILVLP